MYTYAKIRQLNGKENQNLIKVLKYIATEENYLSGEEIQYKKLYKNVLKPKFIEVAQKYNISRKCISKRQYTHLRKYKSGKFPINITIYLLALYEIMLDYRKKADLTPLINDISYTKYILNDLRYKINVIVNTNEDNINTIHIDPVYRVLFNEIYDRIIDLDTITGTDSYKIYNNIW